MRKLIVYFFLLFLIAFKYAFSQDWTERMHDPNANFYDVQRSFNDYWQKHNPGKEKTKKAAYKAEEEGTMDNYMQYKRWEAYMAPRVYPSGNMTLPVQYYKNNNLNIISNQNQQNHNRKTHAHSFASRQLTWSILGPTNTIPAEYTNTGWPGAGRVNCFAYNPLNHNTVYCGAADGGLWVSYNAGQSWGNNTDQLADIGVSSFVIDPADTNIMYLATGDADGGISIHPSENSIGVLQSTNDGQTWSTTGLNYSLSSGLLIYKLIINPSNPNILFAATNAGIYYTTNAASSWTSPISGDFSDVQFQPGNPSTIYAATFKGTFYVSTNSGLSFTQTTNGLPAAGAAYRMEIGVTPANSNYVYLLASQTSSGSYGYYGMYLSTNAGTSFTTQSTTPNILNESDNGSGTGGQGWYDLSIAVNPENANEVVVGGVNIWMSTSKGVSWKIIGDWEGEGAPLEHGDVHSLVYLSDTSKLYTGNDGGCFYTSNNGGSWLNLSNGLDISQAYALGLSADSANLLITGWQDNGTNMTNGKQWYQVFGGDGLDCFIDYSNDKNIYMEYVEGALYGSFNEGASFSSITSGITESGGWYTPITQDPAVSNTIYAGFVNVWKSTNNGGSWTKLTALGGNGSTLVDVVVAPSNNQYIYAANSSQMFVSSNGGSTWTNISSGLPGNAITYIMVKPTNPDSVWVTFSGYNTNRVYFSANAGSSWTNVSTGLPSIPTNCIVYQKSTNDLMYAGTDVGVYYKKGSGNWASYSNGLPNVQVDMLEINYVNSYIEAATYGRSIWQAPTIQAVPLLVTVAFSASPTTVCPGASVQFTDASTSDTTITGWKWTFYGGTPSTSNSQNPLVIYNYAGTYKVTETVYNIFGNDSLVKTSFITVNPEPSVTLSGITSICAGASTSLTASGGRNYHWSNGATSSNITVTPATTTTYTLGAGNLQGCVKDTSITVTVAPAFTTLLSIINVLCYSGINGSATAILSGGNSPFTYTWNTSPVQKMQMATGLSAGSYTINIMDNHGCTGSSLVSITQPSLLTAAAKVIENASCNGSSNGSASLISGGGTSPYTYLWNDANSQQNAIASGLVQGSYIVIVNDNNGCETSASVTITQPASLYVSSYVLNNVSCNGGTNGSAGVSTVGGTSPYTYSWSGGNSVIYPDAPSLNQVKAGTYSCTISDINGCTASTSLSITSPAVISGVLSGQNPTECYGSSTGNISAMAAGGTPPYTYAWSNGSSSSSVSQLTAGKYWVSITDINDCATANDTTILVQPGALSITITAVKNVTCYQSNNGSARALVSGGKSPYTYSWSNLQTNSIATSLRAGNYTVIINDANECSNSATVAITQPATTVYDSIVSFSNVTCLDAANGCISVGANYGTPPYNFKWSSGTTTTQICNLRAGSYACLVTDANGCTNSVSMVISHPALLTDAIGAQTNVLCYGASNGSSSVTAQGGTAPYRYLWSTGQTLQRINSLIAGMYTVTVTDANGCTASTTTTIAQPPLLVDSIASSTCISGSGGEVVAGAKGGTQSYRYSWSPSGGTKNTAEDLSNGSYTVTVTDKNACIASASVLVNCSQEIPGNNTLCCNSYLNSQPSAFSLQPSTFNLQLNIIPNPSRGFFTIEWYVLSLETATDNAVFNDQWSVEKQNILLTLEVYNVMGNRILTQTLPSGNQDINITEQPAGMYILRFVSSDGHYEMIRKIIKE